MSRNIFGHHNLWGAKGAEASGRLSTVHRTALLCPAKNYLAPNVNSARVAKP